MKHLILVTLLLCLAASSVNAQTRVEHLEGQILDKHSKQAIPFARVWLVAENHEVEGSFAGKFSFPEVKEGTHILQVFKEGYISSLHWFEVTTDSVDDKITIELSAANDSLPFRDSGEYRGRYLVVDTAQRKEHTLLFVVGEHDFFEAAQYPTPGNRYNHVQHKSAKSAFLWMVIMVIPRNETIYPRNIINATYSFLDSPMNPWCCLMTVKDVSVPLFIQPSPEFRELQKMVRTIKDYYALRSIPLVHFVGPE